MKRNKSSKMSTCVGLWLLGIFLFFPAAQLQAQTKILTLDEAVSSALDNNNDVEIARMEVEKAQAAVDEAFGYALPSVDVSASFAHFLKKSKMPFPDFEAMLTNSTYGIIFQEGIIPEDPSKFREIGTQLQSFALRNNYEAKAEVTQILFNSAVFRGIGASEIYLNLSKEMLRSKISTTVLDVKKAFYGVLLTKQLLEILNASYENAMENVENVRALNNEGLASDYDLMRAEVVAENIRPDVLNLENKLQEAKDGLKVLTGIAQRKEIDVSGKLKYSPITIPEADNSIEQAYENNYDIRSLRVKRDVDEAFVDIDRSEYWPTLAAFGNYTWAGSSDDLDFQNYESSIVGLSFSMNLFKGGRTSNKVEQSLIGVRQTEEQLYQLEEFTATQIRSQIKELKRVEALVEAQERNVTLAEKAYDIAQTQYNEGTGTQLEIKNANIELQRAKVNRLQSVYDYIIAVAELEKLVGDTDKEFFSTVFSRIED